jgi:hypothetical protein
LIDEAERSEAPFASKIGAKSGIGRDSGGDAGEFQHGLTQSYSENNNLSCYWLYIYDECRQHDILKGGGLHARVTWAGRSDANSIKKGACELSQVP